jgi:hypothetical protein
MPDESGEPRPVNDGAIVVTVLLGFPVAATRV